MKIYSTNDNFKPWGTFLTLIPPSYLRELSLFDPAFHLKGLFLFDPALHLEGLSLFDPTLHLEGLPLFNPALQFERELSLFDYARCFEGISLTLIPPFVLRGFFLL